MNDLIIKSINKAIEKETKRICEEEANAASARVYERVRFMYGTISTRLLKNVDFEYSGQRLIISVRINEQEH